MKLLFSPTRLPGMLILLAALLPATLLAQPTPWENIGPEGGPVYGLVQHPTDNNTLYAAPYGWPTMVFKSTDHGQHWFGLSSVNGYFYGFTIQRSNPQVLAGYYPYSLYKSTNGGQTWNTYYFDVNYNWYVEDVTFDPATPSVLHAAGAYYNGSGWVMGYMKSTNGGQTWTGKTLSTGYGWGYAVDVDPLSPQNVYVGGYIDPSGRIFKSTDGGGTFNDVTGTLAGTALDILADAVNPGRVYAGTAAGVFKSTNGGTSWIQTPGYVPAEFLAQNRSTPDEVFAASWNGVYRTTNAGGSWTPASSGITGTGDYALIVEPTSPAGAFFANQVGVFRSTNAGSSWQACNSGLCAANITALRCAPSSPNILLAAFYGNGVFKTTAPAAASVTWERLPDFYACHNLEDIIIAPTDPNKIYAMEGGG